MSGNLGPSEGTLIPRRWREVLMKLHHGGFEEAIIAGGALRDLLHGRAIKDIDVWVIDRGYDTKLMLDKALGVVTDTKLSAWGFAEQTDADYQGDIIDLLGIYEFSDGGAWQFQIMTMRGFKDTFTYDTVSKFDIGLCHVWSEDGVTIQADAFYRMDAAAKTLTIVHAPDQHEFERSMARIERLLKKYPDFEEGQHVKVAHDEPEEEVPF